MIRLGYALSFVAGTLCCAGAFLLTGSLHTDTDIDTDTGAYPTSASLAAPSSQAEHADQTVDQAAASDSAREAARNHLVSQEMIDRCLNIAEEIDEGMAHRLRDFCSDDPENCHARFMRIGGSLIELARLQDRDPELYERKIETLRQDVLVGRKAEELRRAVAASDEMIAAQCENELRSLVSYQLILTIKERGDLLNRLESEAATLRDELNELATNFAEAVDTRIEELKCSPDPVKPGWPARPLG